MNSIDIYLFFIYIYFRNVFIFFSIVLECYLLNEKRTSSSFHKIYLENFPLLYMFY